MRDAARVPRAAHCVRRQRRHRQRVDLLAHAVAERRIDELVARDARQAANASRDDQRLEMLAVAGDVDVLAGEAGFDRRLMDSGVTMCLLRRCVSGDSFRSRA